MATSPYTYTPPPDDGKWTYSIDEEQWSSAEDDFDTREAALAAAISAYADENGYHGYIGRKRYMRPHECVMSGEDMFETIEENLACSEEWGWHENTFVDATPEQAAKLSALLEQFVIDEGLVPTGFWAIDDVESVMEASDGK